MTPDQRKAETERLKRVCEENSRTAKLRRAAETVREGQPTVDPLPAKSLASAEKAQKKGLFRDRTGTYTDLQSRIANDDTLLPDKK